MGKMKIGIYYYLIVGILTNFYRNVPWVNLHQTYKIFVQTSQFDWLSLQLKGYICKKKQLKNQLSRSCKGDKAETLQECS